MILTIGVTLLVGLMVILVIASLISRSRNRPGSDYHYYHGDVIHHGTYSSGGESRDQESGSWGGRDMSHDHHDFGDSGDSGGGDAGGGDGGGGGGE